MPCQHPGKILLRQYLEPQKISQNKLARAVKVPPRRINEIIHEKRGITADTATRLSLYFGNSASYWMHLQAEYDIERVKKDITIQLSTIQPPHTRETIPEPPGTGSGPPRRKPGKSVKNRIMR